MSGTYANLVLHQRRRKSLSFHCNTNDLFRGPSETSGSARLVENLPAPSQVHPVRPELGRQVSDRVVEQFGSVEPADRLESGSGLHRRAARRVAAVEQTLRR